jgi:hypothetical protein
VKAPARKMTCSKCGGIGHNARSCEIPVVKETRADGVPVRVLPPGVGGADLARGSVEGGIKLPPRSIGAARAPVRFVSRTDGRTDGRSPQLRSN